MFFSINGNKDLTHKYIKSVTYILDRAYEKSHVVVTEPPFILSRSDYGRFIVHCEIKFQLWTKFRSIKLDHFIDKKKNIYNEKLDLPRACLYKEISEIERKNKTDLVKSLENVPSIGFNERKKLK